MPYRNYPTEHFADLRQMLEVCSARYGEKLALTEPHSDGAVTSVSYRRLFDCVRALGTALLAKGLGGKRILLCGSDRTEWVISYLSVICGVGVVVPADSRLSPRALASLIRTSGAACAICSVTAAARLRAANIDIPVISFAELPALFAKGNARLRRGDRRFTEAVIDPDAPAAVIYTCGSSGRRRGVMFSHRNICAGIAALSCMVWFGEQDVFLSALPLSHPYVCVCGLLAPLSRGSAVAICRGVRRLPFYLRSIRPTVMLCVPALIEVLYGRVYAAACRKGQAAALLVGEKAVALAPAKPVQLAARRRLYPELREELGGKLRLMISFGAGVKPNTLAGLRAVGVLAVQSYGVAECVAPIAVNRDCFYHDLAAGMTVPETLLDIYGEQEDGNGEIRFRGENVMLGYTDGEARTREVLRDGWLYTGDLGRMDENGFLFITGRKRRALINKNGKRIVTEEVERRFLASPFVCSCRLTRKEDGSVIAVLTPNYAALISTYGNTYSAKDVQLEMMRALANVNSTLSPSHRIDAVEVE